MSEDSDELGPIQPVQVARWPTEIPLLFFVALATAGIWLLLAVSIFGILYVGLIGLFLFFTHLVCVTHVRGSAVRLGPYQFPELYERVVALSRKAGLREVPEAYLMEAGGSLNAFASKLFRSRFVVLYSDLLTACRDQPGARDMVIGHEIGHIRAGHLDWMWLLLPGMFVPFLGGAYSRARELTCDRYGAALCGDEDGALAGLTILAAGGEHGRSVDLEAFAAQTHDLETGWMTLGKWLSAYPPLCDRVAAIRPALRGTWTPSARGPLTALSILVGVLLIPTLGIGALGVYLVSKLSQAVERAEQARIGGQPVEDAGFVPTPFEGDVEEALARIETDFDRFEALLRDHVDAGGKIPEHSEALYDLWRSVLGDEPPVDPFDELQYGVFQSGQVLVLWSSGPDGEVDTGDEIERTLVLAPPEELPAAEDTEV